MGTVDVVNEQHVLRDRQDANGRGDDERDLDPLPHLGDLLRLAMVDGVLDLLLAANARAELCDRLGLHLRLGRELRHGLVGPALDGRGSPAGDGRPREGTCGEHRYDRSLILPVGSRSVEL